MEYAIIGAGRSGRGAARLLANEGHKVLLSDSRQPDDQLAGEYGQLELLGVRFEFGGHSDIVLDADAILLSPGVSPEIEIVRRGAAKGIVITNEIEVAAKRCQGRIIGITGTNGKTTTTELIGHCCRLSGREAWVAGNVGTPFSEIAPNVSPDGIVALELSSFQLENIDAFRPDVAVLLNLTPDHLDRYATVEEYGAAKLRIALNMGPEGSLIYNRDDTWLRRIETIEFLPKKYGFSLTGDPSEDRPSDLSAWIENGQLMLNNPPGSEAEEVIDVEAIGIRGPHNLANAMAASLALRSVGILPEEIAAGLRSFRPLPHRLEEVAKIDGVLWVNDSKGTNTDALMQALLSFSEPIVLIVGGRGKKNDYATLRPIVRDRVRGIVTIGEEEDNLVAAFSEETELVRGGSDFRIALERAASMASPGDVVLLSPACASFDMFRSFEHRGDVFKDLVREREKMKR
jgi:UDP-N-acetylmuramoylalanine--D-glutamate ligase